MDGMAIDLIWPFEEKIPNRSSLTMMDGWRPLAVFVEEGMVKVTRFLDLPVKMMIE